MLKELDATTDAENAPAQNEDSHPVIPQIVQLYRQRVDLHRAEKSLTLQIKAKCRQIVGGDKDDADKLYAACESSKKFHAMEGIAIVACAPFFEARDTLTISRKSAEKQLGALGKELPIAPWVNTVHGFSWGSLAAIVGEAGDLNNYANPAKLWKRMGLAVMPDGTRQRLVPGVDAIAHGYVPRRRAVVWNIQECFIKLQAAKIDKDTGEVLKEPGPYREFFDKRKAIEIEKNENGQYADLAEHMLKKYTGAGATMRDTWSEGKLTPMHLKNRAARKMGKRFLVDLWKAW